MLIFLIEQLKLLGCSVGQVLSLDVGWIKILWMPGGIIKDKEDLKYQIFGLQIVFRLAFTGMAFFITTAPLSDNPFYGSSCSHAYSAVSIFLRKGS